MRSQHSADSKGGEFLVVDSLGIDVANVDLDGVVIVGPDDLVGGRAEERERERETRERPRLRKRNRETRKRKRSPDEKNNNKNNDEKGNRNPSSSFLISRTNKRGNRGSPTGGSLPHVAAAYHLRGM